MSSIRNYQHELDGIIYSLEMRRKTNQNYPDDIYREAVLHLFLHSCCAPFSSYVLDYLSD